MKTTASVPPTHGLPTIFQGRWFFVGLALGLIFMSGLGRRAARSDYHPNFTRFFPAISPEASYYPTVDEMCAIVRARCRPDQVLVIVGGNSVLQGVWQPADLMWSRRLQEELGERYCVINFALRGATPTDGGAVVAEVLRREYPRQIYIANEKAATGLFPLGGQTYRSIFWEAYFKGRLLSDRHRNEWVRNELTDRQNWAMTPEIVGSAWLDDVLRFHDFWNRLSFEKFNTVPSLFAPAPPALFSPRKLFTDEEPDGTNLTLDQRYLPAVRETEMKILRGTTILAYAPVAGGGWQMKAGLRGQLDNVYEQAFPASLHRRTLLLVGRDSSFFRHQLTAEELNRDEQGIHDMVTMLRAHGYAAMDYGADFTDEDYADRTHLAPVGGQKLADAVAREVRSMAEGLDYLK